VNARQKKAQMQKLHMSLSKQIKFQGRRKQNRCLCAIAKFIKIHLYNQNIIANNAKFISSSHGISSIFTYVCQTPYVIMLNRVRPVMVRVSKPQVSRGLHMSKIPYVAPKLYNKTIFSVRLPAGQAPGYATNCTCLAGKSGPCQRI